MSRIRVLLIAEAANPEWVSGPLLGWSHSRALAERADVHVVTQVRNRDAFLRAGVSADAFTAIDSENLAGPVWRLASRLRGGAGKGYTTAKAFGALSYYYFEHLLWKALGRRVLDGEFDLVHRLTPVSPTWPSLVAARCQRAGIPFVIGPLNGGLPWPPGFDAARRREREWLSYVRGAYRLLPGYRATRESARAIVVASRATLEQIEPRWRDKCVYLPENGIELARFPPPARPRVPGPIRAAFLGRLVPYKGVDMLLDAAAPLLADGRLVLEVFGDGPERVALEARSAGLPAVTFHGWIEHDEVAGRLSACDTLVLPSVREFGGGVVLEAMALGVAPIVLDYGGPGELVAEGTGVRVPLGSRAQVVAALTEALGRACANPEALRSMGAQARAHVLSFHTWEARARQMEEVYGWVLGRRRTRPDFGLPLGTGPDAEEVAQ